MIGIPRAEIKGELGTGLRLEPGTIVGTIEAGEVLRLNRASMMISGLYSKAHRILRKQKASGTCQKQNDTVIF